MNDDDDNRNIALAVVAGVVALVIALVIGVATWSMGEGDSQAKAATAETTEPANLTERIYFDTGSAALPADSMEVLNRVAELARAQAGVNVVISGFHDATGNAASNEELSKERALAVRHALEANGVAPDRLVLAKPAVTTGGGDEREARRVELTLQP